MTRHCPHIGADCMSLVALEVARKELAEVRQQIKRQDRYAAIKSDTISSLTEERDEARAERDCLSVCSQDLQAQVREHLESIRKLDDMWRHRMQAQQSELDDAKTLLDDAKGAMADNKRLREALEEYGTHGRASDGKMCERSKHSDYPCTCGLERALAGEGCE